MIEVKGGCFKIDSSQVNKLPPSLFTFTSPFYLPFFTFLLFTVPFYIFINFHPEKIILFGSYALNCEKPDSDVDLLVIMESSLPHYKRSVALQMLFRPMPCAIDILVFTPEEVDKWNGTPNHIITEAFLHGKVLYE
ncbi:MAG: nucleotidyltransferase domain-containing protein [Chitinispirillia bacterium]|jgi:predicted nucleotidyltransferase